jgi:hypothetical protein
MVLVVSSTGVAIHEVVRSDEVAMGQSKDEPREAIAKEVSNEEPKAIGIAKPAPLNSEATFHDHAMAVITG